MTSRVINNESELQDLLLLLQSQKLPLTVEITKGRRRSVGQNRLQRMWINEISEQLGDQTPEEIRALCKLTIGVPILRAENELFRVKYDSAIRGLDYETKLSIMAEPLDLPVTRIMTTAQKTKYLDGIHKQFSEQGVILTDPDREAA